VSPRNRVSRGPMACEEDRSAFGAPLLAPSESRVSGSQDHWPFKRRLTSRGCFRKRKKSYAKGVVSENGSQSTLRDTRSCIDAALRVSVAA